MRCCDIYDRAVFGKDKIQAIAGAQNDQAPGKKRQRCRYFQSHQGAGRGFEDRAKSIYFTQRLQQIHASQQNRSNKSDDRQNEPPANAGWTRLGRT